jgi:hypothetical protein
MQARYALWRMAQSNPENEMEEGGMNWLMPNWEWITFNQKVAVKRLGIYSYLIGCHYLDRQIQPWRVYSIHTEP